MNCKRISNLRKSAKGGSVINQCTNTLRSCQFYKHAIIISYGHFIYNFFRKECISIAIKKLLGSNRSHIRPSLNNKFVCNINETISYGG